MNFSLPCGYREPAPGACCNAWKLLQPSENRGYRFMPNGWCSAQEPRAQLGALACAKDSGATVGEPMASSLFGHERPGAAKI